MVLHLIRLAFRAGGSRILIITMLLLFDGSCGWLGTCLGLYFLESALCVGLLLLWSVAHKLCFERLGSVHVGLSGSIAIAHDLVVVAT